MGEHDDESSPDLLPPVARRRARFLAYLVDGVILAAVSFGTHLILFGSVLTTHRHGTFPQVAVGFLLTGIYGVVLAMRRGGRHGQTFGKQLLKIRVIRDDGDPATLPDLVVREVARAAFIPSYISGAFVLLGLVDPGWVLTNANNRALHDLVARTVVLEAELDPE